MTRRAKQKRKVKSPPKQQSRPRCKCVDCGYKGLGIFRSVERGPQCWDCWMKQKEEDT